MDKYQELSPKSKRASRILGAVLFLIGLFFLALAVFPFFFLNRDFPVIFLILGIAGMGTAIFVFTQKKELTPYGREIEKAKEQKLLDAWYFRYPLAVACCGLAVLSLIVWLEDRQLGSGPFFLLLNPVTGILWAITGLLLAWELSLLILVVGVGYLAFLGISAIPTSVAVITGALIISYTVYLSRR